MRTGANITARGLAAEIAGTEVIEHHRDAAPPVSIGHSTEPVPGGSLAVRLGLPDASMDV